MKRTDKRKTRKMSQGKAERKEHGEKNISEPVSEIETRRDFWTTGRERRVNVKNGREGEEAEEKEHSRVSSEPEDLRAG